MARDYNVKQHDVREVEYNIYEDPIFKTTFAQLSVSDIKDGKGKIHTYDGEYAEMIYDILVGKDKAINKSTYDEVVNTLIKTQKKYADLERDYQYYVKDKNEKFNKLEKYINELEDTIHKERKKHNEATKLNDDLHKDLAQWKQMYEDVCACYNREIDINRENEGLMKERDKFKKDAKYFANEYKKCVKIIDEKENEIKTLNQQLGNKSNAISDLLAENEKLSFENAELHRDNKILQTGHNTNDVRMIEELEKQNDELQKRNEGLCKRLDELAGKTYCSENIYSARISYLESENDKLRQDLAEQKLISAALEKQIGELKLENECQNVTIKKHEKHIGAYATEVRDLRRELARVNGMIECQEIAHNSRYLKSENDKLRTDLAGAFEDVKKLFDEKAILIKRQDELTFENAALRDNAKYWREQYEGLEKKRATWRENQELKKELAEETAARKALNERCQELEKEYVSCMDTIKAQQRAVSDLNAEKRDLETKLKNAQESNGKIWSMYAEQYAKNVERCVPDFGLKMENRRLTIEIESLNKAHQELMDDVANSNKVIERLKKEIERLEKEPKYMQISSFRAGSMVLKLMGENHKLRKDLDDASMALSEKDCALAEARAELMKRRPCYCCPFKS